MCSDVAMLRIYPSIMASTVRHFLKLPIRGVVLQCYGAGNIPSNRQDILEAIRDGASSGVIILVVTQCPHGGVSADYETGQALLDVGAIPGSDITGEAALAKLAHILSLDISFDERREMMQRSLVGEMTVQIRTTEKKDEITPGAEIEMIKAVAASMNLSSGVEVAELKEVLMPCLMCSAVYKNNFDILETCFKESANISAGDYDGRTPLHIACSEGNYQMTKFLLERGALVHKKDRNMETPLLCAIQSGALEVVRLLLEVGAHLSLAPVKVGERMVAGGKDGNLQRICCLLEAGADLHQADSSGQTCLGAAETAGHQEILSYFHQQ